jgi:hypothetical protein
VLRAQPDELVKINLTADSNLDGHVTLTPSLLWSDPRSSYGIPVGDNPDTRIAPGENDTLTFYADKELGTSYFRSYGDLDGEQQKPALEGLFGAIVVEPEDAIIEEGEETGPIQTITMKDDEGDWIQVHEHVLMFRTEDRAYQASVMPYNNHVGDVSSVNYRTANLNDRLERKTNPGPDGNGMGNANGVGGTSAHSCDIEPNFCGVNQSSNTVPDFSVSHFELRNPLNPFAFAAQDPETPVVTATEDEPVVIRFANAAGHQMQSPSVDGHYWASDPGIGTCKFFSLDGCESNLVSSVGLGAHETMDAWIPAAGDCPTSGGTCEGGQGDYLWGTQRSPFIEAGQWGIFRVCGSGVNMGSGTNQVCPTDDLSLDVREKIDDRVSAFADLSVAMAEDENCHEMSSTSACIYKHIDREEACIGDNATGRANVSIPYGGEVLTASDTLLVSGSSTSFSGFAPHCANLGPNGTVALTSEDSLTAHDPATWADEQRGDGDRCFVTSAEYSLNDTMSENESVEMSFTYDNEAGNLTAWISGTARDCTHALNKTLSNDSRAVLRYQDDLNNGMKGFITVEADAD